MFNVKTKDQRPYTRHVTRIADPARTENEQGDRSFLLSLDRLAASLGGVAEVSARSNRTGACDGLSPRPSDSKKPQLAKDRPAVAGVSSRELAAGGQRPDLSILVIGRRLAQFLDTFSWTKGRPPRSDAGVREPTHSGARWAKSAALANRRLTVDDRPRGCHTYPKLPVAFPFSGKRRTRGRESSTNDRIPRLGIDTSAFRVMLWWL